MGIPLSLSEVPAATPSAQYIATAGQTVFPYPFPITQDSDLVVVVNGVTQSVDVGYSLSGQGNALGGFVTFGTGLAGGSVVTVYRDIIIERVTQIAQNSGFSSVAFNAEFNNIYLILQQLANQLAFSLQIPFSNSPAPITTLQPGTYANSILSFDANGNPQPALFTPDGVLTASATAALLAGYTAAPSGPDKVLTSAEITAGVTPVNYGWDEGDIRRYGASTVAGDNSAAINNALLVSASGGNAAFIPGGTWVITSTLNATGGCSMYGVGQASRLAPTSCDGITFATQGTYEGSRFFRDFEINAVTGTANNGIICDFSAASGNRITQVTFARLTIQNFMQGVYAHGMWNCVFEDCWLYNNYQGYWMFGQNIQCTIRGGFCQKGSLTGAGTQIGLNVTTNTPTNNESTQSLKVQGWGVYAYAININLALSLYVMIEHCDISVATTTGINLVSCASGTIIRDCWIQTNFAGPTTGIAMPALGAAIKDAVVIEGCTIICNIADAGSIGINVGNNHNAVTITKNTIGTVTQPWAQALVNNNCNFMSAKYNVLYASSSTCISIHSSATGVEIGPNTLLNGQMVFTTPGTTPPQFSYYGTGSYVLNLSGISGATATITWFANGRSVRHTILTGGAVGAASGGAATLVSTGNTSLNGQDIPYTLWPTTTRGGIVRVEDNSTNVVGFFGLTNAGVFTLFSGLVSPGNFNAAGSRGLVDGFTTDYA